MTFVQKDPERIAPHLLTLRPQTILRPRITLANRPVPLPSALLSPGEHFLP